MGAPIALLTDFGTRDHYVGTMKGVMLRIAPAAVFVDITHEVAPQDVLGAALQLDAAHRFFSPGTIFLSVVDPGVGSARRAIAVEAGGFRFVCPDNGLLTLVLRRTPPERIVELARGEYSLPSISATFEGRDRFAPAAAWLANGVDLAALGPVLDDCLRIEIPEPVADDTTLRGVVLGVDRFGNLLTNLPRALVERMAPARVFVGGTAVPGLVSTYGEVPPLMLTALFGSTDHLEFAVNGGSAAERLGQGRGAPVEVRRILK